MRLAVTADLHYGISPTWDTAVKEMARRVIEQNPDAIIVAGDVAVADPRKLVDCLTLFSDSPAAKFCVPGNHDIWTSPTGHGADSFTIWKEIFPKSAALGGFHALDGTPIILDGIGFVGSIGWYDYAFADEGLGIPRHYYVEKRLPGFGMWNDVKFVRWDHDDVSFTQQVLDRLAEDIRSVRQEAAQIVAVTHHLAFRELVVRRAHRGWAFHNAFMGTPRLGDLLLAEPKVCLNVCGHSHHADSVRIGHVEAINVGATYTRKRFLLVHLDRTGILGVGSDEVKVG